MAIIIPHMCALQGLSEPVGALVALLLVKPFLNENVVHYLLAFVGGIMVRLASPAAESLPCSCMPLRAHETNALVDHMRSHDAGQR